MTSPFLAPAFSIPEFNRRALFALRGLDRLNSFGQAILAKLKTGAALTANEQRALYGLIHDNRHSITDASLKDWAAAKVKGADL